MFRPLPDQPPTPAAVPPDRFVRDDFSQGGWHPAAVGCCGRGSRRKLARGSANHCGKHSHTSGKNEA
jgi:hypothetical protein